MSIPDPLGASDFDARRQQLRTLRQLLRNPTSSLANPKLRQNIRTVLSGMLHDFEQQPGDHTSGSSKPERKQPDYIQIRDLLREALTTLRLLEQKSPIGSADKAKLLKHLQAIQDALGVVQSMHLLVGEISTGEPQQQVPTLHQAPLLSITRTGVEAATDVEISIWKSASKRYKPKLTSKPFTATVNLRVRRPDSGTGFDISVPVTFDNRVLLEKLPNSHAYGEALTAMLFKEPEIREAWARIEGYAAAGMGTVLRLRLRIDNSAELLHHLRWELLRDPFKKGSLCKSQSVIFSRYLDAADLTPVHVPVVTQLRALALVASPVDLIAYTLTPLDIPTEVARLSQMLEPIPHQILSRAAGTSEATRDTLFSALAEGFHILYLVCHGTVQGSGSARRAYLWLENSAGQSDRMSGDDLVAYIATLPLAQRPLLIVLMSCYSSGGDAQEEFLAAIGPQLAKFGVGAVVGVYGQIQIAAVEQLMPYFFQALRKDGVVDRALAQARSMLSDDLEWWKPILFMRLPDGRLWQSTIHNKE
jgi:hypothetical protein